MRVYTFRLKPGTELRVEVQKFAAKKQIKAGFIVTCVAGFDHVKLRMAGAEPDNQDIREYHEKFELVSLAGTLSNTDCHLHMSVSDKDGKVIGGHLKEARVSTTAEVVIGEDETKHYAREHDSQTGFSELKVLDL